jgi:hypothetical protein
VAGALVVPALVVGGRRTGRRNSAPGALAPASASDALKAVLKINDWNRIHIIAGGHRLSVD